MIELLDIEENILNSAIRYAKDAGELVVGLMKQPLNTKEKKNRSDLVTEADVKSEALLRSRIMQDYPHHWMMSEETDGGEDAYRIFKQPPAGYGWIIDPIDGTTNFIHNIPHFSISIGIVKDGLPIAGVVYNPVTEELFTAIKHRGAYMNGHPIQTGSENHIGDALLATGFQATEWRPNSVVVEQISRVAGTARNVRIIGSASLDLCMVASGRLTGFWHGGLYPWDVAAGIVILQEAGGIVTAVDGKPFCLSDHTLVASNRLIHEALLTAIH